MQVKKTWNNYEPLQSTKVCLKKPNKQFMPVFLSKQSKPKKLVRRKPCNSRSTWPKISFRCYRIDSRLGIIVQFLVLPWLIKSAHYDGTVGPIFHIGQLHHKLHLWW